MAKTLIPKNASIWCMGEKRHPTLNFSPAKTIYSTYLIFRGCVERGPGCTLPKYCFYLSKTVVGIKVLAMTNLSWSPCI